MTKSTFVEPLHDDEFRRNGYTVLPPLDAQVVAELRAQSAATCPAGVRQMYSNVHDLPLEVNTHIGDLIQAALAPVVRELLSGYEVRGGSFLVKGTGHDSECLIHQDWNAQDESEHLALVAWVPLTDVDVGNGCLVVAPGTHDVGSFPTLRGANISDAHFALDGELADRCVSLPLSAGDICIFAQNLFHGSWANQSDHDRVALYAGLLPVGAPTIHYLRDSTGTVRRLEVDNDFYYSGEAARWASGTVPSDLDTYPSVADPMGTVQLDELLRFLRRSGTSENARRWRFSATPPFLNRT